MRMTHSNRTRTVLGLVAAAAMITLSACGGGGDSDSGKDSGASDEPTSQESASGSADEGEGGEDAPATPEADLEGIPDVVAEVNGEEVTKEEFVAIYEAQFQQAAMQSQMGGEAPDQDALKKQVADDLVDTELLSQEAESRGLEVSDEDVDAELTTLAEQNQLTSAEELLAALEKQGITEDQARDQIETQVMVEQLVADEGGDLEPTEKKLRSLYDQAKKQQAAAGEQGGQELPPFDQVRDQIEQQAKSEEIGKVAQTLVEGLREDADITVNL